LFSASDDESQDSDLLARIFRHVEAVQKEITSTSDGDLFSLVLLGQNGDGKSMLTNLLVSISCPIPDQYGYQQEHRYVRSRAGLSREKSRLLNSLAENLEAVQYIKNKEDELRRQRIFHPKQRSDIDTHDQTIIEAMSLALSPFQFLCHHVLIWLVTENHFSGCRVSD
jgi:ABC-type multidrug transport system ATPase subunit